MFRMGVPQKLQNLAVSIISLPQLVQNIIYFLSITVKDESALYLHFHLYVKPLLECNFKPEAAVQRNGGFESNPRIKEELGAALGLGIAFYLGEQRFGDSISAVTAPDKQPLDLARIVSFGTVCDAAYRRIILKRYPYLFYIFGGAVSGIEVLVVTEKIYHIIVMLGEKLQDPGIGNAHRYDIHCSSFYTFNPSLFRT